MPVELGHLAPLLKDRWAAIAARVLAPSPEGPVRPDTAAAACNTWNYIASVTCEQLVRAFESGRLPSMEFARQGTPTTVAGGLTLADALVARSAFCREIGRELAAAGASAADVAAAVDFADRVIGLPVAALVEHVTEGFHAERSDLLTTLDGFDVVVFRSDPESRLLSINDAGVRGLGAKSKSELIGRPFDDFYADPADRRALVELLGRHGQVRGYRFRIRRLDGQVIWCEVNMRAVPGPTGAPVAFEGYARDVTERVAAEEGRLKLLASLAALGVCVFRADHESRILTLNDAGVRMLGASCAADVIGKPFAGFYADQAERLHLRAMLTEREDVKQFRFRLRRLDGAIRWCETNIRVVIGPDGELLGFEGFARDLTELVEAELKLHQTESRYRELVEAANSIILRMDTEGRVTFLNEFGERFFGFRKDELVGRSVIGTIVPETESSGRDLREMILDIGRNPDRYAINENENTRKNGERVWISWTNKAILDEAGGIIELLCVGSDATARRKVQEELRRSEERYRALVENLRKEYIFYSHNTDGVFTYVSRSVSDVLGFSQDEFLAHYAKYMPNSELNRRAMEHTQLSIAGQQQPTYELETFDKGGALRRMEVMESPVFGPDGRVTAVDGIAHDITERYRAEEELRHSQERYRDLVENLTDVIYTVDGDGRITYISPVIEGIAGYRPDEIVGRFFAEFIFPEDLALVSTEFAKGMAGDTAPSVFRLVAKSGELRWVRTTTRPEVIGGRTVGLQGLLADVTEHRRAGEELRRSQERYRELVENLNDAIYTVDTEGRFTYVSPVVERALGFRPEDLAGRHFLEMIHPDDREAIAAEFASTIGGEIKPAQFRILTRSGEVRWARTSSRPVVVDGKVVGLSGSATDVTALVEAGEEVRRISGILDDLPICVFQVDEQDRLSAVSRGGARLFGGENPADFVGRPASSTLADPEEFGRIEAELNARGFLSARRALARRLDGSTFWAEFFIRGKISPEGRMRGAEGFVRDVTALVEAESARRRTAELLDKLPICAFELDREGRILTMSADGLRMVGATEPGQVIGHLVTDFYARPAEAQAVRSKAETNPQGSQVRVLIRRLDGSVFWTEGFVRAVRDKSGEIVGREGFLRDINLLVEAQAERERISTLVDKLPIGAFEMDKNSVILTMSAGGLEMVRAKQPSDVIGRRVTDFYVNPAEEPGIRAEVETRGQINKLRLRIRRLDGVPIWVESFVRAVRDTSGEIVGREGFIRDITDLVEAEGQREQFERILTEIPICVLRVDESGRISMISAGGCKLLGASGPEQLLGRPTEETWASSADRDRMYQELMARGRVTGWRARGRRLDGSSFWFAAFVRLVRDEQGRPAGTEGFLHDITELVEAEQALESERSRLEQVVRSVGAGLCLLDRNLRVVWMNELLAGKIPNPEQAVGCICHTIFAYSDRPCEKCPALRTLETGGQFEEDVTVRRPDGREVILRLTTSPVRDETGKVVQVLELAQDVTAQRAAEAERQRTSGMLAGILSSAGEYAIVATDAQGTIGYFSEGAERLFGVRQSGPVGRLNIADLWLPEARAALGAELARLSAGGRYEEDVELLRAQGLTFTARVSGSARVDDAGGLTGYTFVIRDVTEERAAQKLVSLLAHAIESSREGVALTDMSGVVTYVNPTIAAMTGREPAELLGKDVSILYSRETPGEDIRAIARATLAGGWSGEVAGIRSDGSTFPAYMTTSLVRDERGRAVAMVGLWRDISREKSLQKRLFEQEQRHLAELERQVRERTAELERAYRDLQKLDSMKDRFLTNVSHELRTPLVSGVGYIELILHEGLGPVNDDMRKGLRVAHRNLLRLVNLIDDLLTFTRLGSGREAMVMTRFDLAEMVNSCLLDLKVRASKKNLHVEMEVERGLPPIEGDEENIHRVFTNLLSNAEKFTGDEATIRVSARRASETRVEVTVADDGVGIPAEELAQVFERFYRSQRTSSPRYGGTGIGLSLVKEILEAHGCTVRAESPEGRGTAIIFTLPLAVGTTSIRVPRQTGPLPEARPRPSASILVIDDDADVHDLLRTILKDTGDRLTSAKDGRAGLAAAAGGDFDLVFLDLSMEGMDGMDVLRELRKAERSRHTPVYVLTARADDAAAKDARAAGATGLLVKPFTIAEVRQTLDEVMSGDNGARRDSGRLPRIT